MKKKFSLVLLAISALLVLTACGVGVVTRNGNQGGASGTVTDQNGNGAAPNSQALSKGDPSINPYGQSTNKDGTIASGGAVTSSSQDIMNGGDSLFSPAQNAAIKSGNPIDKTSLMQILYIKGWPYSDYPDGNGVDQADNTMGHVVFDYLELPIPTTNLLKIHIDYRTKNNVTTWYLTFSDSTTDSLPINADMTYQGTTVKDNFVLDPFNSQHGDDFLATTVLPRYSDLRFTLTDGINKGLTVSNPTLVNRAN